MHIAFDLAIVLLGSYHFIVAHMLTDTKLFTEALLITAKDWKQPKCSSVGDWFKNYDTCIKWNIMQWFKQKTKNTTYIVILNNL